MRWIKKIAFVEPNPPDVNVFSGMPLPRLGTVYLGTILRQYGYNVKSYVEVVKKIDIREILSAREGEDASLHEKYLNAQFVKLLRTIGFNKKYVRAEGPYLFDEKGNRYLDCLGGYGVFNIGRNHPKIKSVIKEIVDSDLASLVQMDAPLLAGLLAEKLISKMPEGIGKVFFTNSGTESIEGAIKFAKKFTGRNKILFWDHAFHGLTTGSLALNGNEEFKAGFGELLPYTQKIPFDDLDSLERHLQKEDVAAFVFEPIQGKGINIARDDFYPKAEALCRKYGALLIIDEVQTGFGRTGKWFSFEHWGLKPDIVCVAKALSGGFIPVGAILYKDEIYQKVYPNMEACMVHSNTFGRNSLAMGVGLATLQVMEEEKIVERAEKLGEKVMNGLRELCGKYEMIKEVRGKGLMFAVEFGEPKSTTLKAGWKLISKMHRGLFAQMVVIPLMRDYRILSQVAGHHMDVIRMLPPLVMSEEDVAYLLKSFDQVMQDCHRFPGSAWKLGKELAGLAVRAR